MANYYFVYRPLSITSLGGVVPNLGPDDGVYLGQMVINDWYCGYTTDYSIMMRFKAWGFIPVIESTYDGLRIYGLAGDNDSYFDEEGTEIFLTEDEKANRDKAKQFLMKLDLRGKIDAGVNDIYDLFADLAKRITLVERGLAHVYDNLNNATPLPQEYTDLAVALLTDVGSGAIVDVIDINGKTKVENYNTLKERVNAVRAILQEGPYFPTEE